MTEKSLPAPSLFGFTQFCGAQPAEQEYDYLDNKNCAFGQYLKSIGYTDYYVGSTSWEDDGVEETYAIPHHRAILAVPRTFGALYIRLKSGEYRG
jgi:hypothetical protein